MTSATAEAPPAEAPPADDWGGEMTAAYDVLFRALLRHGSGDWTVAELDALGLDEHIKVEIDDGSLFVSPQPLNEHQEVVGEFRTLLKAALGKRHKIYHEPEVYISERRYYAPDIVVCRQDWLPPKRGYRLRGVEVALAVEVGSPGTLRFDQVNKARAYAEVGIPAYWRVLVDPELTVVEYRLPDGDATEYEIVAEHVGLLRTEVPGAVEVDLGAIEEEVFGRFR